jgi:hypothetical protein
VSCAERLPWPLGRPPHELFSWDRFATVRCSAKGNGRKVTSGIPEPVRNSSCSTLELVFGCRANSATSSGNTGIVELYAGLLLSHRQFTAWVEITHPRGLKGWLEPERARLEVLRSLEVDAATWDRNGRDTAFLNHRNKRLGDVTALVATERCRRRLGKLELERPIWLRPVTGITVAASAMRQCGGTATGGPRWLQWRRS